MHVRVEVNKCAIFCALVPQERNTLIASYCASTLIQIVTRLDSAVLLSAKNFFVLTSNEIRLLKEQRTDPIISKSGTLADLVVNSHQRRSTVERSDFDFGS